MPGERSLDNAEGRTSGPIVPDSMSSKTKRDRPSAPPDGNGERETVSGLSLQPSYGPDDIPEEAAAAASSLPGDPPFLRGGYPEDRKSVV